MSIAQTLQNPLIVYNDRLKQTFSPIQAASCSDKLQEIAIRVGLVAVFVFAEFFLGIASCIGKLLDYFNDPGKEVNIQEINENQALQPLAPKPYNPITPS